MVISSCLPKKALVTDTSTCACSHVLSSKNLRGEQQDVKVLTAGVESTVGTALANGRNSIFCKTPMSCKKHIAGPYHTSPVLCEGQGRARPQQPYPVQTRGRAVAHQPALDASQAMDSHDIYSSKLRKCLSMCHTDCRHGQSTWNSPGLHVLVQGLPAHAGSQALDQPEGLQSQADGHQSCHL